MLTSASDAASARVVRPDARQTRLTATVGRWILPIASDVFVSRSARYCSLQRIGRWAASVCPPDAASDAVQSRCKTARPSGARVGRILETVRRARPVQSGSTRLSSAAQRVFNASDAPKGSVRRARGSQRSACAFENTTRLARPTLGLGQRLARPTRVFRAPELPLPPNG
jgi:hypothetical protein